MSARLIFFMVATAAAIGSAVVAGLGVAVVGLSARVPAATLITLIAGASTAVFGGAIALAGMAASLFFSAPKSAAPDDSMTEVPERRNTKLDHWRLGAVHRGRGADAAAQEGRPEYARNRGRGLGGDR